MYITLAAMEFQNNENHQDKCAGILEQSMGARNRVGIGLSYRPARLHRLAESISLESIPGLLKSLKIPSQEKFLLPLLLPPPPLPPPPSLHGLPSPPQPGVAIMDFLGHCRCDL